MPTMDASQIGRMLVWIGLGLAVLGGLVWGLGRFLPLGQLPGDFSYEGENTRVYVPLATMIVLSVMLTLLVNIVLRFFR